MTDLHMIKILDDLCDRYKLLDVPKQYLSSVNMAEAMHLYH